MWPVATRILLRALGLRRSELARVWPVSASYAALLASLYVLKPTRNSLFLDVLGLGRLPWVMLAVAVLGGAVAFGLVRISRGRPVVRVLPWLLAGGAVLIVGFRWLLGETEPWRVFAFYVAGNLFGQIATSLVWLWATASFDTREAKNVFGFIAGAGIFGASIGGLCTHTFVARTGTLDLLWLGAGFCVLSAAFARRGRTSALASLAPSAPVPRARALFESPLVTLLSAGATVGAVTSALVDLQFNALVDGAFPDPDDKTAFFGGFFALLNLGAFAFQLFVSGAFLRRFGIGPSVSLLPVSLILSSLFVVFQPSVSSGAVLKTADVGLRHSLGRSVTEVLFAPLVPQVRLRARVLLDAVFDNLGNGLGAGLGLLLLSLPDAHSNAIGIATLATVLASSWLSFRLRPAYLDALKEGLSRRDVQPEALDGRTLGSAHVELLVRSLESSNLRQVAYALEVLGRAGHASVAAAVRPLLEHPEPMIRERALASLASADLAQATRVGPSLLDDPNARVRARAMQVLAAGAGDRSEVLRGYLSSDDPTRWQAALACIAAGPEPSDVELLDEGLLERARAHPAVELELVRAVGRCSAELEGVDRVDWLLLRLSHSALRDAVAEALARVGPRVLPKLERVAAGATQEMRVGLARTLARMSEPASFALLQRLTLRALPFARGPFLEACLRRRGRSAKERDPAFARALVESESRWLEELLSAGRGIVGSSDRIELSRRALLEKQRESRARLVRGLSFSLGATEIRGAEVALGSARPETRARGLGLLEEVLRAEERARLLPLFELRAERPRELPPEQAAAARDWLLGQPDPWLRACAAFAFGPDRLPQESDVPSAANLGRVLTVVEKVLLLQNVDVFADATSEQLSLVAAVAVEQELDLGARLYSQGEAADAMYVVVRGQIRLHRDEESVASLGPDTAFGTWALFEEEPRLTSATAEAASVVLRIDRAEFFDVLADHVGLTRAILARVARRLRVLLGPGRG